MMESPTQLAPTTGPAVSQPAIGPASDEPLAQVRLLGVRVNPVTIATALQTITTWISQGDRGRWVIATGMHGLMEAHRDQSFRQLVERADLFLPDGYAAVWMARRRGFRVPGRVCGSELLWECCRAAEATGHGVFFYGDTPEVLDRLCARLLSAFPRLRIVGSYAPPFRPLTPEEDDEVVRRINAAKPDVLWVGLGLPKQEWWIVQHRPRLQASVLVGVGAAFKLVSGDVRRAPRWVGEHGFEWLWRFLHEPRRLWRRVLLDVPSFTMLALREELAIRWARVQATFRLALKRAFDISVALCGLVVSFPIWLVLMALIKREDGGPVFYRQERIGQHGKPFRGMKFRTMIHDADARFGPCQATEHDPRITRIGRWLRRTALDELPQLWNILTGDMSFVGPRALAAGEIEVGENSGYVLLEAIPGYAMRHRVRPGLTGIAQIFAPRDIPRRHKFRYDRVYIQRQSFWLDLRLMALSFWITFRAKWESRLHKL